MWRVATRNCHLHRPRRPQTMITRICLRRATSSLGFLVVFSFVSRAFLVFALISTHWFEAGGGFLWLVCAGWGLSLAFGWVFFCFKGVSQFLHSFLLIGLGPEEVFYGLFVPSGVCL